LTGPLELSFKFLGFVPLATGRSSRDRSQVVRTLRVVRSDTSAAPAPSVDSHQGYLPEYGRGKAAHIGTYGRPRRCDLTAHIAGYGRLVRLPQAGLARDCERPHGAWWPSHQPVAYGPDFPSRKDGGLDSSEPKSAGITSTAVYDFRLEADDVGSGIRLARPNFVVLAYMGGLLTLTLEAIIGGWLLFSSPIIP
jgi:hypothetical protein